jgi:hypothetical protein
MESGRVSVAEWRQMSETEQRAMIRAGMTDVKDLPDDMRAVVEELLADFRPITS